MKSINFKIIKKCFAAGVLMLFFGMAIQVIKGQLIFKKETPEVSFIIEAAVAYIVMGFLYSLAFYIFKDKIPGKTPVQKGIMHSLFISVLVILPGVLGLVAFDHEGLFNLNTPFKLETYSICFIDILNIFINGLFLGRLFSKDIIITKIAPVPKVKALIAAAIGFFLFPSLMLGTHLLGEQLSLFDYVVPIGAEMWYYMGLIVPLAMTGSFLPIFYFYVKDTFSGNWAKKAVKFSLVFFALYWIISVGFMLIFGYSFWLVFFYLIISVIALIACSLINGLIFINAKKECKGVS